MSANGSRRWFQYTDDLGLTYAVELDENIYETSALGFAPIDTGATGPTAQGRVLSASGTRPLQMRRVRGQRTDANGDVFRKTFYVGTAAALTTLFQGGSLVIGGSVTWSLSSFKGEERQLVPASDTGQLQGDTDSNLAS